jgi:hypothetical protein
MGVVSVGCQWPVRNAFGFSLALSRLDCFLCSRPASNRARSKPDNEDEHDYDYDFEATQEALRQAPFLPGARRPWRRSCGD